MNRRLVPLLFALASTAACAASHDPHLARIAELEEQNARLERENAALEARVNGVAAPAPPIETRCAKNGAGWRITSSGRNELIGNVAGVRRDTKPTPFFSDGKFAGMRLSAMAPGSIGPSCGFEVGDIVRTVNGIEPTIAKWDELEAVLRKTNRIEIELLRGREALKLSIEVGS